MYKFKRWRVLLDAMVLLLVVFNWVVVLAFPPKENIHTFNGEPIQIVVICTNLFILGAALFASTKQLSWRNIGLLAAFILLDVGMGKTFWHTGIPLYLDTIGCIAAALLLGTRFGVACSASYYLILALWDPGMLLFAPLNMVVAIIAGKSHELGGMANLVPVLINGLFTGLLTSLLAAPLNITLLGPIIRQGQPSTAQLLNEIRYTTIGFQDGFGFSDPLDKTLTFLIAYILVVWLPQAWLKHHRNAGVVLT
ncbi:hypothetical protein WG936_04735 [Corynebacterium sp. H127]|uniref:hypothetical protein n=1 Tax=Corynebacterium sp. H127 TaxID=3133418 RepID=UPI0030AA2EAF